MAHNYGVKSESRAVQGFTLLEILIVVAIIGLTASMIIPSFAGVKDGTDLERAKTNAVIISTAKDLYLRERGQAARTAWAAAATDEDKFALIRAYPNLGDSTTLATFMPAGFTATLGALGQPVTLKQGSTVIAFP